MDEYLCLPHITKRSYGSTPLSFMMVPSTGNFRFRSPLQAAINQIDPKGNQCRQLAHSHI
ncbi:hypothetical protein T07_5850 [Trichinella nelsoni]|uniref:Uncharacterized protein n=1 Tax=Trichinella nelsoni TaxID=6336 RepID=A0A0V0SEI5_9BILA|nr:hypothetical protein T07_5850 [Trichinella nelsoni]